MSAADYGDLLVFRPLVSESGDLVPRPEMTALAHLLAHSEIAPDVAPGALLEERALKRANEDLGQVLALARQADEAALIAWPAAWEEALKACFPGEWESLGQRAGAGLRALLASDADMEEAHAACVNGPLAGHPVTAEQLRITGLRLLQDVVEPLEHAAAGWDTLHLS